MAYETDSKPTAVLGRMVDFQALGDPPRLLRGNASYSDARLCVLRLSITRTTFSASGCNGAASQRATSAKSTAVRRSVTNTVRQPTSGSESKEPMGCAVADVLEVETFRLARRRRQWRSRLADELLTGLVQANHRPIRVEGTMVNLQHVFHRTDKLRVRFRRDAPLLLQPRLHLVFF